MHYRGTSYTHLSSLFFHLLKQMCQFKYCVCVSIIDHAMIGKKLKSGNSWIYWNCERGLETVRQERERVSAQGIRLNSSNSVVVLLPPCCPLLFCNHFYDSHYFWNSILFIGFYQMAAITQMVFSLLMLLLPLMLLLLITVAILFCVRFDTRCVCVCVCANVKDYFIQHTLLYKLLCFYFIIDGIRV